MRCQILISHTDSLSISSDHAPFISPKFNVNAYANAILAGEPYDPEAQIPAPPVEQEPNAVLEDAKEDRDGGAILSGSLNVKGDVGLALAKLDYGIVSTEDYLLCELTLAHVCNLNTGRRHPAATTDCNLSIPCVSLPVLMLGLSQITDKHDILLDHLSESTTLSTNLSTVRTSLFQLDTSLNKLQTKIHTPYVALQSEVSRLEKARTASELLRRAGRFLVLARRLETQMGFVTKPATSTTATPNMQQNTDSPNPNRTPTLRPGNEPGSPKPEGEEEGEREREMLKAALTIAELGEITICEDERTMLRKRCAPEDTLLGAATDDQPATGGSEALPTDMPLESLDFVAQQAPVIARSKETIISEMENMVVQGLANLVRCADRYYQSHSAVQLTEPGLQNQPLLSTSLQTAYNMRLLPQLVQNLLADLNDAVESRIAKAFDMTSIGKEVAARGKSVGALTEKGLMDETITRIAEQQSHTPASAASSLLYRTTRGKHGAETAPSNQTIGTWTQVLWKRMDMLIEDISQCCIKVYTLEKVLRRKRDAATQVDFLTEAMKVCRHIEMFCAILTRLVLSVTGGEAIIHILDDTCDVLRYTSSSGRER
jgi:hypothetical protein